MSFLSTVIAILLLGNPASGQPTHTDQEKTEFARLAQVKRIYVPLKPRPGTENSDYWRDPNTALFQDRLLVYLAKGKRVVADHPGGSSWAFIGDCSKGYETYFPGVVVVCSREDADAELLGSVTDISKEATTDERRTNLAYLGMARLYDVKTNAVVWETSQTSFLKGVWEHRPEMRYGDPLELAGYHVMNQFGKDMKKAQKLAAQ